MSNVTQMVEDEAARAEAEAPDELEAPDEAEEDPESVPDEPGEPEGPDSGEQPASSDADARAFVSELKRHEKAVAKAMGLEVDQLVVCAVCAGSGFAGGGTEIEQKMANEWLAANDPAREYATREDIEPCPDCHALGMMKTGSRVPGQDILPCNRCNGAGYVTKVVPYTPPPNGGQTTTPTVADAEAERLRSLGYTVVPPYVPSA